MANPFDQFDQMAQAEPRVRPAPIQRPEPVDRPGDSPRKSQGRMPRPDNPFDRFDPPVAATPEPSPQAAVPSVERFRFKPEGSPELRPQPPPAALPDMVKSFGAGLVRGATGLVTLPAEMEQAAGSVPVEAREIIPEPLRRAAGAVADYGVHPALTVPARGIAGGPTNKIRNEQAIGAVETVVGPLHTPETMAGEYARTVGEFAPGAVMPGGGIGARVASTVAPAIAAETAGQLTRGSDYEAPARIAGGVIGAGLPSLARRAVTPFPSPYPERARLARVMEREGVPLTAGEQTGNRRLLWAESAARDTPFSGARVQAQKDVQAERFTQAALRRAGINAERATDDVINTAFERVGRDFERIASATYVPVTPQLAARADQIARAYQRVTEPSLVNPLPRAIADDLAGMTNPSGQFMPALDGRQYSAWRSDLGAAARAAGDPRTERAIYDLQRLLDDAAEQSLRRAGQDRVANSMSRARREYRNLLVLAKARAGAGEDGVSGIITPKRLEIASRQMEGATRYARGQGDFTALANAGVGTISKMPNSGTPARLAAQGLMMIPGAMIGASQGGVEGSGLGALAALAGQGMMARGLMSRPLQAYMRNQTMTRAIQNSRRGSPVAVPVVMSGASAIQERRK